MKISNIIDNMRIPHIIDYYSGDDSIMNMHTKLCVIIKEKCIRKR